MLELGEFRLDLVDKGNRAVQRNDGLCPAIIENMEYLTLIQNEVLRDIKDLADVPWPEMTVNDNKITYRANGSVRRRS